MFSFLKTGDHIQYKDRKIMKVLQNYPAGQQLSAWVFCGPAVDLKYAEIRSIISNGGQLVDGDGNDITNGVRPNPRPEPEPGPF